MTTHIAPAFAVTHAIETSVSPSQVWSLLSDVTTWRNWNSGIEAVSLEGPFATGTWFTMKPPGQDAMRSQLLDVRANQAFIDETRLDGLVVRVTHRLEPVAAGTRITYLLEADGPGADQAGPAIAADFPEVLRALVAAAQQRAS